MTIIFRNFIDFNTKVHLLKEILCIFAPSIEY